MRNKILLFIILFSFLTSSCLKTGYLKFDGKKDEIIASQKIKDFMKKNQNPSIVLRVPNCENKSTQSDPNSYIYSAIEKELMIGGFNVKDRGLFNEVVRQANSLDYEEIKNLTGTDLILELIRVDIAIKHETNTIYTEKNEERVYKNSRLRRVGAAIEFKITIIENNDYGGSYSFYYTPCGWDSKNDCSCQIGYKRRKVYPHINMCEIDKNRSYEAIEKNVMEEFVRDGVKRVINEIRNN